MPSLCDAFENTFGTYEQIEKENPRIVFELDDEIILCIQPKKNNVAMQWDVKPVWLKKVESNFHKARDNKTRYDIYV